MNDLDQGLLRPWLDVYAEYAGAIQPSDPRYGLAEKMQIIIAAARDSLHPSPDSTANYVDNREVIQELATLKKAADELLEGHRQLLRK